MTVRRAAVAGTWYPGDAASLRREVEGHLATAAQVAPPGRVVGLVSPHAGLHYSGPVAAFGYAMLRGRRGITAVLVGPSHRAAFDGIALQRRGAFETPLGEARVDETLADALADSATLIREGESIHRAEHSLEMQLPFLQCLVPDVQIVPLLMGTQSRSEVDGLAAALVGAVGERQDVVLVASSDLSHYHSAAAARRLDAMVLGDIAGFDEEGLMARLERDHSHACGGGPVVAVMKAARSLGARESLVLRYADSGDVPGGDKERVVGYVSAALLA
jgi:AmmeMemoRadiSam system protein B